MHFEIIKMVLNGFKRKIFSSQPAKCTSMSARFATVFNRSHLKISSPNQILQILPKALAQVKLGNTSENLLNEIRQIINFLYRAKEVAKKVYNNIMNSIKE